MKTLENLKYPIGKFEIPASFNKESIEQWISIIREFPQKIQNEITSLSEAELEQQYRLANKPNNTIASLRILERIRTLSKPVELSGKSRR